MGMLIYVCNKDKTQKQKRGYNNVIRKINFKKVYRKHNFCTCINTGNQFFIKRNPALIRKEITYKKGEQILSAP